MSEVKVELRVRMGDRETAETVTMQAPDGKEREYARRILDDLSIRAQVN